MAETTDKFDYSSLIYLYDPPCLWRIQLPDSLGKPDPSGTGDIVAGDGGGHERKGGFADEEEFAQAAECHWDWDCRRFPGIGGPFLSVFSDYRHAKNWARGRRQQWWQSKWRNNQRHLRNASWKEKMAYREPKQDEWPVAIHRIDLSLLPPTPSEGSAGRPALFESNSLRNHINKGKYRCSGSKVQNEFLILYRIPRESIVHTYTSFEEFEAAEDTTGPISVRYYVGFIDDDNEDKVDSKKVVCSHRAPIAPIAQIDDITEGMLKVTLTRKVTIVDSDDE